MANQIHRPAPYSHNTWRKEQIFVSMETANGIASGGVIPNVNDEVVTFSDNIKFEERVTFVDPITHKSTLEPISYPNSGNNAMVGIPVGVANLSNVANLWVNPLDDKLSAGIDGRLPVLGTDLTFCRVFRGTDISDKGQIISMRLDSNGDVIDDKIPLLKADVSDDTLRYIAPQFNVTHLLPEDTICTVVFYGVASKEIMFQELAVKYNHVIANVQHQSLFINDVYLVSPYQNPLEKDELLVPKNLLNTSFTPRIFKEYQNGSKEELIPGTSNVSLIGWGDHITGEGGEEFPLVLTYILGKGEMSQKVDLVTGKHIAHTYKVIVVDTDSDTEVKLFVVPTYDKANSTHNLRFFIYSGTRTIAQDVTDSVTMSGFVGDLYGDKQTVHFSLDMRDIQGLPDDTHSESIDILLTGEPLANTTWYRLWYWRDDSRYYGDNLRAKILTHFGTKTLSLQNGIEVHDDWLEQVYYRLEPIYDNSVVERPMSPDYVDIHIGEEKLTMDVATYWNGELDVTALTVTTGDVAILKWFSYNQAGDRIDLAASSMTIEVV